MKRGLCLLAVLTMLFGTGAGTAEGMEGFEFADKIPAAYQQTVKNGGTVHAIEYPSKDYTGDGAEITKKALVYLPPEYSEDQAYDLLILCHGIGGNEKEWGFNKFPSTAKSMIDNLILNGEIRPLIIVMPNGRSTAKFTNTSMNNAESFYHFGQEIRNDLLPYIDAHYATYGSRIPDDLSASRDHRAMAGLSMGGMQTINIGMCECLDLFSAFGAFSAAPTSYDAKKIAKELEAFPDMSIRYFYSICGQQDDIAYWSASAAAKNLPDYTDRLTEANWHWQERTGAHNFTIWNLGLYNFVQILSRLHAE